MEARRVGFSGARASLATLAVAVVASLALGPGCTPGGAGASITGPYQQTCGSVVRARSTLTAVCTDFFGTPQATSIVDDGTCPSLENVNGALRCVRSQVAVGAHGPRAFVDIVSLVSDVTVAGTETKVWRIDQPDVTQADVNYPAIAFREGDVVSLTAGGCVQTGGHGLTWKSYVDPRGGASDTLYAGTGWVPGSPIGDFRRLSDLTRTSLLVGQNLDAPTRAQLSLHLGYQDDSPADNGYWSHDDGDGGQCRGVGPAWVEVTVVSGATVGWSPHTRPFDLVWQTAKEDFNGLPTNPRWGYQLDNPGATPPSFESICGSAIAKPSLPTSSASLDETRLAAVCSSQAPTADLYTDEFLRLFGLCPADPLNGHLNWLVATYTGQVHWADYSGPWPQDGDYNLTLVPPDGAGLTSASSTIGLEFRGTETLDHMQTAWWKGLAAVATDGVRATSLMGGDGGLLGVVTGLVGLDAVHGAYTESHPVFALALRTAEVRASGAVDETWDFFLRTSGNEGECSAETHFWDSPTNEYFIELPWPAGATDVTVLGSELAPWQPESPVAEVAKGDPSSTLIRLTFPSTGEHGADGEVRLRYTLPPVKAPTALAATGPAAAAWPAPVPRAHDPEPELELDRILDPKLRQQFETELRDCAPPSATHLPGSIRALDVSRMQGATPMKHPPRRGTVVHPRHAPPAAGNTLRAKRKVVVERYLPRMKLAPRSPAAPPPR
jgi:hypothetical protein